MIEEYLPPDSSLAWQKKFNGLYCQTLIGGKKILLLKPETYMNRSGESVRTAAAFFKVPTDKIIIAHDDIELPFGTLSFRRGGGLGGHNGLRSITKDLGTRDFFRFRLGIGRPERGDVFSHVLGRFSSLEEASLPDYLSGAVRILIGVISSGLDKADPALLKKTVL
jgi:PTH1 family peptidyl-tRNA hydrolase